MMGRINQTERRQICERLLAGDVHAQVDLADLYHAAGMPTMAQIILSVTRSQAQKHARIILGGGPVVRPLGEILSAAQGILRRGKRGG